MTDKYSEELRSNLDYTANRYSEGECNLDDVLLAARKIEEYERNEGYNLSRLAHNPREKAFHDQWLKENEPRGYINNGHGLLQDLFIEGGLSPISPRKVLEEINPRDRTIVATVIQWLGSNCGMCFLGEALSRFGATITYKNKNSLHDATSTTVKECDASKDAQ
jgi:hypothetical protein